jgi:hypothetical protein
MVLYSFCGVAIANKCERGFMVKSISDPVYLFVVILFGSVKFIHLIFHLPQFITPVGTYVKLHGAESFLRCCYIRSPLL